MTPMWAKTINKEWIMNKANTAVEEVEQTESDEAEIEAQDAVETDGESVEVDEKPKKKGGYQRKIERQDRLIMEQNLRIEQLEKQLTKPKEPVAVKPKKEDFGDDSDAYLEALADWKIEQRLEKEKAESRKAEDTREYQKAADSHRERVSQARQEIEDYDDVISEFMEDHGDLEFSKPMFDLIQSSDVGAKAIYELAKDKKEFDRLNKLSLLEAAKEFGKLEIRLTKSEKQTTKTPAPIKPVKTKTVAVDKDIFDPSLTMAEYNAIRDKQEKARNRA